MISVAFYGGCGRSSQCSDESHLASSLTVPCGALELLSWKIKWPHLQSLYLFLMLWWSWFMICVVLSC